MNVNGSRNEPGRWLLWVGVAISTLCFLMSCGRPSSNRLQGYIEGEFVYVSSPLAGTLEKLQGERGAEVKPGDLLFILESTPEKAARDEAERRLAQARANLEDAKKGKRRSEIQSMEAELNLAKAALELSEKEVLRQDKLVRAAGT